MVDVRGAAQRFLWTGGLLLVLFLAACGGGGKGDNLAAGISDETLMSMALAKEELGDEYADFELSTSGVETREERTVGVSEDEAEDLKRFEELKSYRESYQREGALAEGSGPFTVGVTIYLFQTESGASAYLQDDLADLEQARAKVPGAGLVENIEHFALNQIGDESIGFRATINLPTDKGVVPARQTAAWIRRGRLLALFSLMRLDEKDVRDEVGALAQKLDERIEAVLAGQAPVTPAEKQ
jgi:hypothetical protein